MAMCCFVSIAFPCNEPAKLRELAAKYLSEQVQGDLQKESVWFLEALAKESGYNRGPKGDAFSWSLVSNHCGYEAVIVDLMRFFSLPEFWKVGPFRFERIIAFFEKESSRPIAYEYATITLRIKQGFAFDALVHADNAARIEAFCEEAEAMYAMEWNKGDSSEQWKLFEFNGFREAYGA